MRINENNYVDKAEEAIKSLVEESKQKCRGKVNIVTTSKIRNLLAMTADIYNQVLTYTSEKLDDEICGRGRTSPAKAPALFWTAASCRCRKAVSSLPR